MHLTDEEKAMLDGRDGAAVSKAMDLLVRYGEALGAERLVETRNVCATITATTPFQRDIALKGGGMDAVFSEFSLDSAEVVKIPKFRTFTNHLQLGFDPEQPERFGLAEDMVKFYRKSERETAQLGAQMVNTCTPYQVGNVPTFGEHCAWMESSAIIYCNSVLGARTNAEGRESCGAAMLTARIPDWGYHRDEPRLGTHLVEVDFDIESVQDWGLLGYWVGELVQEKVPVLYRPRAPFRVPNLPRLKHFGAAASSSGGVEMYHIVGVTPEARTLDEALGGRRPREVLRFGQKERRATYEKINATGKDTEVQYVMLGCPHYTLEQIWEAAQLLEGRKVHPDCELWIFTPRAIKAVADRNGYTEIIEKAGGIIMSDSCSAMSRAVPKGTKTVALDSAKQAHYLPAILGVQAWFGTTEQCIDAACTGRWNGGYQ